MKNPKFQFRCKKVNFISFSVNKRHIDTHYYLGGWVGVMLIIIADRFPSKILI